MFGDFLGFYRAIQQLGVPKERLQAWSRFPLHEYFIKKGDVPIKFGRSNSSKQTPIEIYTKWHNDHRQRFWDQYYAGNDDGLVKDVEMYIEQKSKVLEAGDILTIILISHGSEDRGIVFGKEILGFDRLANLLDHFFPQVEVNLVVMYCFAGGFADRIRAKNPRHRYVHTSSTADQLSYSETRSVSGRFRNSAFTGAFVRSVGSMLKDPETGKERTLGEHIEHVRREGTNRADSTPQHVTDIDLQTAAINVIFNDYVDRSLRFSATRGAARRVISPPTVSSSQLPPSSSPSSASIPGRISDLVIANVESVIASEMALIDTDGPVVACDVAVISAWYESRNLSRSKRIDSLAEQLGALRERIRCQENYYLLAEALEGKDFIRPEAYVGPIAWNGVAEKSSRVRKLLRVFAVAYTLSEHDTEDALDAKYFPAANEWLSVLLVRSCYDYEKVFDYIMSIGLLGEISSERLQGLERYEVEPDVNEKKGSEWFRPQYGFWLPFGLSPRDNSAWIGWVREWDRRYSAAEKAYNSFFGDSSWGDCSLIKETCFRFFTSELR